MKQSIKLISFLAPLMLLTPHGAAAHTIAGDRVFPATLAIDDPGVEDELTLPQVQLFKATNEDGDRHWTGNYSAEFAKRITENFGLSVEGAYVDEADGVHGFDNVGIGAKYRALENSEHEIVVSVGANLDLGNTGDKNIAEKHSSFAPGLFIGKGFGDLPDSMDWAKPFAITGAGGYNITAGGDNEQAFDYGFTLQYSLPYLQQHVKDVGITAPLLKNMVPVVEFAFQTPTHNGGNTTTGTINPGFIWLGKDMQFGLEAVLPVNSATGHGVGAQAQLHFFFDDMFPHSLGRPLFGEGGSF